MRDDGGITGRLPGYRFVILTLDSHAAGPAMRAMDRLGRDFPGLSLSIHAAAEWGETPGAFEAAVQAIETADIVMSNLLFLEEHVARILPALEARRDHCDAMIGVAKGMPAIQPPGATWLDRLTPIDSIDPGEAQLAQRHLTGEADEGDE